MKTKQVKQKEDDVRTSIYNALTPEQRLRRLDARLGKNVGARKERDLLQYQIDSQL